MTHAIYISSCKSCNLHYKCMLSGCSELLCLFARLIRMNLSCCVPLNLFRKLARKSSRAGWLLASKVYMFTHFKLLQITIQALLPLSALHQAMHKFNSRLPCMPSMKLYYLLICLFKFIRTNLENSFVF